jgi:UDP-glucose 4-epimerase
VPLAGKRILITGGAGFIGTTLARRLVGANEVVAVDNLHRDALSGTDLNAHAGFAFVQADVLDADRLAELARGCTHIVHCAGIAGVDTVLESPVRTMRVNVIGTYNVLEAGQATRDTLERIVDFSTSEVFGQHAFNVQEGHATSIGSVGEARWTYAVSKLTSEPASTWRTPTTPSWGSRPSPCGRSTSTGRGRSAAAPSAPSSRRRSPGAT